MSLLGPLRAALAMLLVVQCLRAAFTSPRLELRAVRVSGTSRYAPAELVERAGVPLGENIFRVNLVEVSEVLKRDPVIREAVVSRELPGTLAIEIEERTATYLATSGSSTYRVDPDGVVIEPARRPLPALPLLAVPPSELPEPGKGLRADFLSAFRECLRLAAEEGLNLGKVRIDEGGEVWLNFAVGAPPAAQALRVRAGRPTELAAKFRDIRNAVVGWPDLPRKAEYLDVMCAGRPAYQRMAAERGETLAERTAVASRLDGPQSGRDSRSSRAAR